MIEFQGRAGFGSYGLKRDGPENQAWLLDQRASLYRLGPIDPTKTKIVLGLWDNDPMGRVDTKDCLERQLNVLSNVIPSCIEDKYT